MLLFCEDPMNNTPTDASKIDIQSRMDALMHLFQPTSFLFVLSPDGIYDQCYSYPDQDRLTVPPEQHKGKTLEEVVPESLRDAARFFFDRAVSSKMTQTYAYPHFNGGWMCRNIVPIVNGETVEAVVMEVFDASVTPIHKRYVQK